MRTFSSISEDLSADLYSQIAHYRHKVFVEQLGWPLQSQDGLELDQFDRQDTVYLVAQDDNGRITGCARLLPTTRPYLLAEKFPQLLNGLAPPRSPDVWELSRFAAIDFDSRPIWVRGKFSSPITVTLLKEALLCAEARGAKQLITISPLGVERLLQHLGISAHRAGPPMIVDGRPICACWIDVASVRELKHCEAQ